MLREQFCRKAGIGGKLWPVDAETLSCTAGLVVDQQASFRPDGQQVDHAGDFCTLDRVSKQRDFAKQIGVAIGQKPGFQGRARAATRDMVASSKPVADVRASMSDPALSGKSARQGGSLCHAPRR
jgi:hypothetical protein